MYIYTDRYVYTYIYIERERERRDISATPLFKSLSILEAPTAEAGPPTAASGALALDLAPSLTIKKISYGPLVSPREISLASSKELL